MKEQEKYDKETKQGRDAEEQAEWNKMISDRLNK
jgi:hypothetical protein